MIEMFIYMTRQDKKWAGFNFESSEENPWDAIEKESPELWNSLSPDAEVTLEKPEDCIIFDYLDDLIEWVCLANQPTFLVAGETPDKDDLEVYFNSETEALNYAEDLFYAYPDDSRLNVFRLPNMELVWCRGL